MKFKKRKKFVHLLIPRILIAWAVAGILSLGSVIWFFGYTNEFFVSQNAQLMHWTEQYINKALRDDTLEENFGLTVMYMDFAIGYFDGLGVPDSLAALNAKQYAYICDTKNQKVACDTSLKLSMAFLDYDAGKTVCYICPFDELSDIPEFQKMRDNLNLNERSWKQVTGKMPSYNYTVEVTDYYLDVKNQVFYPGNTRISEHVYYTSLTSFAAAKNQTNVYFVDCTDALKDKCAGMKHVVLDPDGFKRTNAEIAAAGEQIGDYRKPIAVMGSNDREAEYIRKNYVGSADVEAVKNNETGTVNPGPFSLGSRLYEQSIALEGEEGLELRYYMVIPDLVKTYQPITTLILVFWFGFATLIALLVTFIKYRKLLYFYRLDDYRKTLMNSMAHDLKTPLASLMGYAENLKENVQTEKREHYAGAIYENAEYMNGIIMDVLDLSKMEDSGGKLHRENINLIGLCEELKSQFAPMLEEKKLSLETEGKFNRRVDKTMMKRAMENLLTNAIKYTKEGGMIRIYSKHVPFSEKLIFENGPVSKIQTKTNKLWEPFVKGDESRSEKNGTGLGLSIVNSVLSLNRLKGKLSCKDEVFRVEIK